MLFYVEGLDKSGKSTFARELSKTIGVPIYRKVPPIPLPLTEHHSFFKGIGFALVELHNLFQFDAIVDRSFISDWVYTNRDTDVQPWTSWQQWEGRHNDRAAIVFYVSVDSNTLKERVVAEPDEYMSVSDAPRFMHLYDYYLKRTCFPVINVSGTASLEDQRRLIIETMQRFGRPPNEA